MIMKNSMRRIRKILCFLLPLAALLFASCEEVQEASKYDNWQSRNEAFIDSIARETGDVLVATEEDALNMPVGKMFKVMLNSASVSGRAVYVYCRKVKANPSGRRPLYTETTSLYYCGSLITGDVFEGNFVGYTAVDQILSGDKNPTEFDAPRDFTVSGWLWTDPIQFMREGERWLMYFPWEGAYGESGKDNIPGYSVLTFDVDFVEIVEDED